jgi:hypothetical protein
VFIRLLESRAVPLFKKLLQAQAQPVGMSFPCVTSESVSEEIFAHDCCVDDNVKFFLIA